MQAGQEPYERVRIRSCLPCGVFWPGCCPGPISARAQARQLGRSRAGAWQVAASGSSARSWSRPARRREQRWSSACSMWRKVAFGCCARHSGMPVKISELSACELGPGERVSIVPADCLAARDMLGPIPQIRKRQTQDFDRHPSIRQAWVSVPCACGAPASTAHWPGTGCSHS